MFIGKNLHEKPLWFIGKTHRFVGKFWENLQISCKSPWLINVNHAFSSFQILQLLGDESSVFTAGHQVALAVLTLPAAGPIAEALRAILMRNTAYNCIQGPS